MTISRLDYEKSLQVLAGFSGSPKKAILMLGLSQNEEILTLVNW